MLPSKDRLDHRESDSIEIGTIVLDRQCNRIRLDHCYNTCIWIRRDLAAQEEDKRRKKSIRWSKISRFENVNITGEGAP